MLSAIPVEKGTQILVSIIASNRNQDVWGPDADEWKPERWMAASNATTENDIFLNTGSGVKYPGVYSSM